MKVMTLNEIDVLNSKSIGKAESGKKALQLPLEEMARHVALHGDYTVVMPRIAKWKDSEYNLTHEYQAAVKWCEKYMGLTYCKETKDFIGFKGTQFVKDSFAEGRKNPYYKGITIAKDPEFDLDSEVSKLIAKANRMMKVEQTAANEGKECKVHVQSETMEALKAIKIAQAA